MGNRYGRNQKRRHRERIEWLERHYAAAKANAAQAVYELGLLQNEVQEWDEEIRRLLGEYSALRRRTPEMQSGHPIREMPIRERIAYQRYSEYEGAMSMPSASRERMRRFVLTIERGDRYRMERFIRFMETDGLGGVAYCISETALAHGFGRREIAYLAIDIAKSLAEHWNSHEAKSTSADQAGRRIS